MKILTELSVGKTQDSPGVLRGHAGVCKEIIPGFFRSISATQMGVIISGPRGEGVLIPLSEIERIAIAAEPSIQPGPGNPSPLKAIA